MESRMHILKFFHPENYDYLFIFCWLSVYFLPRFVIMLSNTN